MSQGCPSLLVHPALPALVLPSTTQSFPLLNHVLINLINALPNSHTSAPARARSALRAENSCHHSVPKAVPGEKLWPDTLPEQQPHGRGTGGAQSYK